MWFEATSNTKAQMSPGNAEPKLGAGKKSAKECNPDPQLLKAYAPME